MAWKTCKECGLDTLYISWSALRIFEECKQKSMLYRGGKKATLENKRMFLPGSVVDRAMRNWLSEEPEKNRGGLIDSISTVLDREVEIIREKGEVMHWKSSTDRNEVEKTCVEAAKHLEPILEEYVVPYYYQPAMRFKAPIMLPSPDGSMEKVVLNGEMDIILKKDNGDFEVWDLKVTKDEYYWKKTLGQLTFYDLATEIMMGQPTVRTGLLQPLCKTKVFEYHVSDDARRQLYSRIIAMANSIWTSDFEPRQDTKICNFCSVKHACSKFKPINDGKNHRIKLL